MSEIAGPLVISIAVPPFLAEDQTTTTPPPTTGLLLFTIALGVGLTLSAFAVLSYRRGFWLMTPGQGTPWKRWRERSVGSATEDSSESRERDSAVFVRSLIALWLVVALILFTLMSFYTVPSSPGADTLIGAIAASAGAAVAFYFSSKAADDARRDILNAIPGLAVIEVPDFRGQPLKKAAEWFSARNDVGSVTVPSSASPESTVRAQSHVGRVTSGTTVTLTTGLGQVTGVGAVPGASATLTVTWEALEGAASYLVGIAGAEDGEFGRNPQTVKAPGVQAVYTALDPGQYWARVDAFDPAGHLTPGRAIGPVTVT